MKNSRGIARDIDNEPITHGDLRRRCPIASAASSRPPRNSVLLGSRILSISRNRNRLYPRDSPTIRFLSLVRRGNLHSDGRAETAVRWIR